MVLYVLYVLQGIFCISTIYHFVTYGYLGLPFLHVHAINDYWMDYANTNFWAQSGGVYSNWKSIYLPFQFLISKFFSSGIGVNHDPYFYRAVGVETITLIVLYVLSYALMLFKAKTKSTKYIVAFLFFSYPSLMALERLNYIIIPFFLYTVYTLYDSEEKFRVPLLVVLVSMKIYLAIFIILDLIKRKWTAVVLVVSCVALVNWYVSTLMGENTYLIFANLIQFGSGAGQSYATSIWMGTSIFSLLGALVSYYGLDFLKPVLYVFMLAFVIQYIWIVSKSENKLKSEILTILLLMVLANSFGAYFPIFLVPLLVKHFQIIKRDKILTAFILVPFLLVPFGINYGGFIAIETIDELWVIKGAEIPLMSAINPIVVFVSYIYLSFIKNEKFI